MTPGRNPDATVRVLDLTDDALAQLAELFGGDSGPATTVDQGDGGASAWLVTLDPATIVALRAMLDQAALVVADAAEDPDQLALPFTVTASGDTTLVSCPAGAQLRLRRITPTFDNTSAATMPRLALFLGADEVARGPVLTGRFDRLGAVDADLVLSLSTGATDVSGTVFYEVIGP